MTEPTHDSPHADLTRLRDWYEATPPSPKGARARLAATLAADRSRRMRPIAGVAALAATALLMLGVGAFVGRRLQDPSGDAARPVELVFSDSAAREVHLVGDFNDWSTDATPMARDPVSGLWRVTVPLNPGVHSYAFVVDGTRWAIDRHSPRAPTSEFGDTNRLLVPRIL